MNFTKAVAVPNKPVGDYYYGKLQLLVPYPHGIGMGDSVQVNGTIYKGKFKVTYIYNNTASKISALYFGDVTFAGNDTGTLEKITTLQQSVPVIAPVNPNPGTLPVSVSPSVPAVITPASVAPGVDPNPGSTSNTPILNAPVISAQLPAVSGSQVNTSSSVKNIAPEKEQSLFNLPIFRYAMIGIGILLLIKIIKNK